MRHGGRQLRQGSSPRGPGQKGDKKPGHGQVQGWPDDQDFSHREALGNLVRFVLLPGQRHATAGAALILDMALGGRIADKAFASNWIIADMNEIGAQVVISQRPRRKHPLDIDMEDYKWRHLIANFFRKIREFKRISMRGDKTDQSFAAMIYVACAAINSR